MQTFFSTELLATPDGQEADRILRSCVHCGFCTATCPTYLLTGNELDSPRGRIYLIKNMLEQDKATAITRTHLDRCLTCQSCETTCPSSVDYHNLLNIGRRVMEKKVSRSLFWRLKSKTLRVVLQNRWLFHFLLGCGRAVRFMLPSSLARTLKPVGKLPRAKLAVESSGITRKMLILNGCVQEGLTPDTNAAASRVFTRLGVELVTSKQEGCCGALAFHLNAQREGLNKARRKIDLLCARLDDGVEAIISTASGCGNFIEQYESLFASDPAYAEKAGRIKAATHDIAQILAKENLDALQLKSSSDMTNPKVAVHCPCTLQHGLKAAGVTESLLKKLGLNLATVKDGHLCCGSAGAYSVMEPEFSTELGKRKLEALEADSPDAIVTSNIGCQLQLGKNADVPVQHWITLIDDLLV